MIVCEIEDFKLRPKPQGMNYKNRFAAKTQEYLGNKQELAWLIKANIVGSVNFPCSLHVTLIGKYHLGSDCSNYLKTVEDALQDMGALPKDSLKYLARTSLSFTFHKGQKLFINLVSSRV